MPKNSLDEVLLHIKDLLSAYRARQLITAISPEDDMHNPADPIATARYMYVGLNALELILEAMTLARKQEIAAILDMPCGFGRVLRHLRAAFPSAAIHACDLYENRVQFCAKRLGAIPIKSKEELKDLDFAEKFDLIWCGSLLTHLPQRLFADALVLFSRSLQQGGIAVVTLHGRWTPFNQHHHIKYISDELFASAEQDFYRSGFGYADYQAPSIYKGQRNYGVSLAAPWYVLRLLEDDESVSVLSYRERAWDDHHDVLMLQKIPITHPWSWPIDSSHE
jgi:SAM-dependent methyltransferase